MWMLNFFYLNYRAKYHKLKYGSDMNPEELKPPQFDKKPEGSFLSYIFFF